MLYRIASDTTTTTPTISGRNLAHAHRTTVERALVGADLHLDRKALTIPTIRQSAFLVGVCTQYVAAAVKIADDPVMRAAVLAGDCPLLGAAKPNAESLIQHFLRSSPTEWLEVSRAAGVDVVWSTMVEPLIARSHRPVRRRYAGVARRQRSTIGDGSMTIAYSFNKNLKGICAMKKGLRTEADVRRLFRERGLVVLTIRRGKHWIVTAVCEGSDVVTRYVLSSSPSDNNTMKIIAADFRRAGVVHHQPNRR